MNLSLSVLGVSTRIHHIRVISVHFALLNGSYEHLPVATMNFREYILHRSYFKVSVRYVITFNYPNSVCYILDLFGKCCLFMVCNMRNHSFQNLFGVQISQTLLNFSRNMVDFLIDNSELFFHISLLPSKGTQNLLFNFIDILVNCTNHFLSHAFHFLLQLVPFLSFKYVYFFKVLAAANQAFHEVTQVNRNLLVDIINIGKLSI